MRIVAWLCTILWRISAPAESVAPTAAAEKTDPLAATEPLMFVDKTALKSPPQFPWGNDPFLREPGFSKSYNSEPDSSLQLTAVIRDGDTPTAMVSGQIVSVGSVLRGGRRLTKIGPKYILLEREGSLIEVPLQTAQADAPAEGTRTITSSLDVIPGGAFPNATVIGGGIGGGATGGGAAPAGINPMDIIQMGMKMMAPPAGKTK